MNIDRILADLRKERDSLSKAIAALEKLRTISLSQKRSVRDRRRKRAAVAAKAGHLRNGNRQPGRTEQGGAKVIPFMPSARRVS